MAPAGDPRRVQPVPAPDSAEAARELLDDGVLVDLAGRPLRATACPHCPGRTLGDTCPRSLACQVCRAAVGQPCRRPSGHLLGEAFGGTHAHRVRAAARIDQARQEAGDPALPAPWPGRVPPDGARDDG